MNKITLLLLVLLPSIGVCQLQITAGASEAHIDKGDFGWAVSASLWNNQSNLQPGLWFGYTQKGGIRQVGDQSENRTQGVIQMSYMLRYEVTSGNETVYFQGGAGLDITQGNYYGPTATYSAGAGIRLNKIVIDFIFQKALTNNYDWASLQAGYYFDL